MKDLPKTSLAAVDDRRIIYLYVAKGWTIKDIARELYWSATTVSRRLHANGITPHRYMNGNPSLDPRVLEETRRLYDEGYSAAHIAQVQGVKLSTMVERMDKLGLPKRPRPRCKRGHLFTAENTRINRNGARVCRTCAREMARRRKAVQRKKEEIKAQQARIKALIPTHLLAEEDRDERFEQTRETNGAWIQREKIEEDRD